jgi:hypothetical protein
MGMVKILILGRSLTHGRALVLFGQEILHHRADSIRWRSYGFSKGDTGMVFFGLAPLGDLLGNLLLLEVEI